MKESLVNYIKDEIHEMPEYLKNKCMAAYIINDEQMDVEAEDEAYGLTVQNKNKQSAIYFNYDLLNTGGDEQIKDTIYHEFWHAFDMYVIFPYEYSSNSEWKNYIKNIMMMKVMIFLSFCKTGSKL
ncbi:MAG: SprT-like domain-containing protein [Holdemanella porci]